MYIYITQLKLTISSNNKTVKSITEYIYIDKLIDDVFY